LSYCPNTFSQIKCDTIFSKTDNNLSSIKFIGVNKLPANILKLLQDEIPDLKSRTNEKIFFSYFSFDSLYFSIGRINLNYKIVKKYGNVKQGTLRGKAILNYQIKFFDNYVLLELSDDNIFPISLN
jgi:hypothetical protein